MSSYISQSLLIHMLSHGIWASIASTLSSTNHCSTMTMTCYCKMHHLNFASNYTHLLENASLPTTLYTSYIHIFTICSPIHSSTHTPHATTPTCYNHSFALPTLKKKNHHLHITFVFIGAIEDRFAKHMCTISISAITTPSCISQCNTDLTSFFSFL